MAGGSSWTGDGRVHSAAAAVDGRRPSAAAPRAVDEVARKRRREGMSAGGAGGNTGRARRRAERWRTLGCGGWRFSTQIQYAPTDRLRAIRCHYGHPPPHARARYTNTRNRGLPTVRAVVARRPSRAACLRPQAAARLKKVSPRQRTDLSATAPAPTKHVTPSGTHSYGPNGLCASRRVRSPRQSADDIRQATAPVSRARDRLRPTTPIAR